MVESKVTILKTYPWGYFMRERATRPVRCFECNATRKRMYYYWMRTNENRQESRSKYDLPFCCVKHYRAYMNKIAPLPEKVTNNSEGK